MKEQEAIDKIRNIELPKEKINESSTRYYDTVVKNTISRRNCKEFFIAENDTIYFLKVRIFNWYARGPADIEHLELIEERFYIMDNEWSLLSHEEFSNLGSAQGLVWKKVQINVA
jgi:hypothetical protein